ncbi:hypothetical protein GCM10011411_28330 [Aurantiacibacter arachoides]|nr:hypothetical protein GCM10011411_28330 [Aurantiacibacter arachoides]
MDRHSQSPRAAGDGQSGREQGKKVIAFDLDISARTVEVYRANLMMKMQAKTLSELVRMVTIVSLPR